MVTSSRPATWTATPFAARDHSRTLTGRSQIGTPVSWSTGRPCSARSAVTACWIAACSMTRCIPPSGDISRWRRPSRRASGPRRMGLAREPARPRHRPLPMRRPFRHAAYLLEICMRDRCDDLCQNVQMDPRRQRAPREGGGIRRGPRAHRAGGRPGIARPAERGDPRASPRPSPLRTAGSGHRFRSWYSLRKQKETKEKGHASPPMAGRPLPPN